MEERPASEKLRHAPPPGVNTERVELSAPGQWGKMGWKGLGHSAFLSIPFLSASQASRFLKSESELSFPVVDLEVAPNSSRPSPMSAKIVLCIQLRGQGDKLTSSPRSIRQIVCSGVELPPLEGRSI